MALVGSQSAQASDATARRISNLARTLFVSSSIDDRMLLFRLAQHVITFEIEILLDDTLVPRNVIDM